MGRTFSQLERKVSFNQACSLLHDGDLLQFRGGWSPVSFAIMVVGRSIYSHSGMAAKIADEDGIGWRCLEVREFIGGRKKDLREYVNENPGRIDVYRPSPRCYVYRDGGFVTRVFDKPRAVAEMLNLCCGSYGYLNILRVAFLHIPVLRLFTAPDISDDSGQSKYPPFCSQAYATAIQRAYTDPVPLLSHRNTEPGDLTRSQLLANYVLTLVP